MKNQDLINMLIYRSWHRGSKETDILLGDFAKSQIYTLKDDELEIYSKLIEESDWDIYEWILNEEISPPSTYASIIEKIRIFNVSKIKNS
jgi:antitoxin CptB